MLKSHSYDVLSDKVSVNGIVYQFDLSLSLYYYPLFFRRLFVSITVFHHKVQQKYETLWGKQQMAHLLGTININPPYNFSSKAPFPFLKEFYDLKLEYFRSAS